MDQVNAQAGADPLQGLGAVGRAVIDDELDRDASLQQRLLEHPFDVERRFAGAESAVSHQT